MLFLYFSGTGNTKYCMEYLAKEWDKDAVVCSLEEPQAVDLLRKEQEIVFGYPVYYSSLPKIVQDFVSGRSGLWKGKKVFLVATMAAFSGDGTGVAARMLQKYGARIIGGLHLKMPDCILDVKALKKSETQNKQMVEQTRRKMSQTVSKIKMGTYPQEGLSKWSRIAGLFGQRLYFGGKTKSYTDKLKIDASKCIKCGKCASLCPMKNIMIKDGQVCTQGKCTMCYRCISNCPAEAVTLLGKKVVAKQFTDYEGN